ncbi:hypothetical protein CMK14_19285 [Candidatus Poribacteria bacterium]|nr:hypothetical protein [Candidatus Poribacteria bacterium]
MWGRIEIILEHSSLLNPPLTKGASLEKGKKPRDLKDRWGFLLTIPQRRGKANTNWLCSVMKSFSALPESFANPDSSGPSQTLRSYNHGPG